jgi:hypothetical protein
LWTNFVLLFADHMHLQAPAILSYGDWETTAVALAYQLIVSTMILAPLAFLGRDWLLRGRGAFGSPGPMMWLGAPAGRRDGRRENAMMITVVFGLLMSYVCFGTFQLSRNWKTWGDYWYGAPFSLLFALFLAGILRWHYSGIPRRFAGAFLIAATCVLTAGELMFFTGRNWAFKQENIFHMLRPPDIFSGRFDVYRTYNFKAALARSAESRAFTASCWEKREMYRDDPVTFEQILEIFCPGGRCNLANLRVIRLGQIAPPPYDNTAAYLDMELPHVR